MEPIQVDYESRSYTWDGESWYGTSDFTRPPQAILTCLDALIATKLQDQISQEPVDLDLVLRRAQRAQQDGQLLVARRLAEQVLDARRGHIGAATILSSILRAMGQPEAALEVTSRFRGTSYEPLLTTRAAALCDLGRWEEALRQIRQVLAIAHQKNHDPHREAFGVYSRIKSNAPLLFNQ